MKRILITLIGCLCAVSAFAADEGFAVIAHPGLAKTDLATLQRLYAGRALSVGEVSAIPVNLSSGSPLRQLFLQTVMGQSEDQYVAYWLVRRYVGKGAPPLELNTVEEVVAHVAAMPGALGYVPTDKVPKGANVIFRR